MKDFYSQHIALIKDKYLLDFQESKYYEIFLRIAPCTLSGKVKEDCGEAETPAASLQDNYYIRTGGPDLLVGWKINNVLVHCSNEFENQSWCGTFLEIHRPLNTAILAEKRITKYTTTEFSFDYISTKKLCAGKYEVWMVFRTRIGYVLKFVKPFFIEYPACSCQDLESIGVVC